ncbi:MAG: protein phosphatase 2C domain-containing protein [Pseudomonadales bacterium]|nr:protein phosphatase 2C domain-containing protein [Pseudomonadales bacterium]
MAYIDFQQLIDLESQISFDSPITWKSAGHSHVGKVRKVNEDAFYNSSEQGLWAVADGMGGFARGDYASGVVAEAFAHFSRANSLAENIRDLEIRLRAAHSSCRDSFSGEKVGSTVVSLLSYGNYGFFLWAGDSRVYRLRDDHLKQITTDHTVAQERYARGELSAVQAIMHPSANVLTRAIGVHQTLNLDLEYEVVKPGDRYLLCSDGLYNDLPRIDIHERLELDDLQETAESLVAGALDRGGRDNISAIVLEAQ